MASLRFLGATGCVTGSRFLLESEGKQTLVDCGLFQGLKELRLRNWQPFPVDPSSLDHVLSHMLIWIILDICPSWSEKAFRAMSLLRLPQLIFVAFCCQTQGIFRNRMLDLQMSEVSRSTSPLSRYIQSSRPSKVWVF